MKLTVLQEDFLKALSATSRFVSSRAQLPVLSNILLSAEKGKLKLTATNLEMGIVWTVGARVEEEGALSVPARIILEIIANLPVGQITLKTDKERLYISTNSFQADLGGILAGEFPQVPDSVIKADFNLNPDNLKLIAKQVVFAAAGDETRPILTGVLLLFEEKRLRAVSTDGFRLSSKDLAFSAASNTKKILLPARVIDELCRILPEKEGQVEVSILEGQKQIIFATDSACLTGRVLEGEFPDFEKILPKKFNLKALLLKEELFRAVKAAGVFAREAASVVRLEFGKDRLKVSAESQQFGQEEVEVDAKTEGEPTTIAFNYKFVLDFLSSTEGAEISFETEGAAAPGVFRDSKDASYTHLIMPVRLQT